MHFTTLTVVLMAALTAATPTYQTALVNIEFDLNAKDTLEYRSQQTTNLGHPALVSKNPKVLETGDTLSGKFTLKAHRRHSPEHGPWYLTFKPYDVTAVGSITDRGSAFTLDKGTLIVFGSESNPDYAVGYNPDTTFPRALGLLGLSDPAKFHFKYVRSPWNSSPTWLEITNPEGEFQAVLAEDERVSFIGKKSK